MALLTNIGTSFILGLLTPLTAVCIIPLYPGFLAFLSNRLSNKDKSKKGTIPKLGALVTLGVVLFMLTLGLIFTTLLQMSLTKVIGIISPIAFTILGLVSLALIFDINLGRFIPKSKTPTVKNPKLNAFLFGLFFGAIVIPCNPAFIAAFFARVALTTNAFANILNFLFFGLGIASPLLALSFISAASSQSVITFLIKQKRKINLTAGIIMLGISLYYLIFVFNIF